MGPIRWSFAQRRSGKEETLKSPEYAKIYQGQEALAGARVRSSCPLGTHAFGGGECRIWGLVPGVEQANWAKAAGIAGLKKGTGKGGPG